MGSPWNIVAFPVILPWREEFWTLPLYFPDLKVGVIPGWPEPLPYQGMPLPAAAEVHPQEFKHYQPGDLRQWQAYENYRRGQGEDGENIIQEIRSYGEPAAPEPPPTPPPSAWALAWQLEKMQADQESQLLLVDKGQDWLRDILKAEPWDGQGAPKTVPGVEEMVDPELAQLRYRLWQRTLAPYLQDQAAPLLLGRTSRALFLTLKGWPEWTALKSVQLTLPGCRNRDEWRAVAGEAGEPRWQSQFVDLLAALLTALAEGEEPQAAIGELQKFVTESIAATWPLAQAWNWPLEIWTPAAAPKEDRPVLCWAGAGAGILPG